MARAWYSYTGGDVNQPNNYLYSSAKPNCRTGFSLCSIYAAYAGTRPATVSDNIKDYIAAGLTTGVPQPTTGTSYVYMKP